MKWICKDCCDGCLPCKLNDGFAPLASLKPTICPYNPNKKANWEKRK